MKTQQHCIGVRVMRQTLLFNTKPLRQEGGFKRRPPAGNSRLLDWPVRPITYSEPKQFVLPWIRAIIPFRHHFLRWLAMQTAPHCQPVGQLLMWVLWMYRDRPVSRTMYLNCMGPARTFGTGRMHFALPLKHSLVTGK